MQAFKLKTRNDLHRWSLKYPEKFWMQLIKKLNIRFQKQPDAFGDFTKGKSIRSG